MSAIATSARVEQAAAPSSIRVTQLRVLRSEWTKFWSVRSSSWTLLISFALTIGLGALISGVEANHFATMDPGRRAQFDPISTSLSGMNFAELAIGVLGVMVITGEYSTGMIRASLTSVPKRLPVLWAKLAVTTAVSLVTMLIASFIAFFLGQALLNSHHLGTTIGADHALRTVIGAAIAVTLLGAVAMMIGALLRNTAPAISTFVAVIFVLPPLVDLLPGSVSADISPYLPGAAADALFPNPHDNANLLRFWPGLLMLLAYVAALTAGAAYLLRRRDA